MTELYEKLDTLLQEADAVNARGLSRVLMDISERVALIECLKASE